MIIAVVTRREFSVFDFFTNFREDVFLVILYCFNNQGSIERPRKSSMILDVCLEVWKSMDQRMKDSMISLLHMVCFMNSLQL